MLIIDLHEGWNYRCLLHFLCLICALLTMHCWVLMSFGQSHPILPPPFGHLHSPLYLFPLHGTWLLLWTIVQNIANLLLSPHLLFLSLHSIPNILWVEFWLLSQFQSLFYHTPSLQFFLPFL